MSEDASEDPLARFMARLAPREAVAAAERPPEVAEVDSAERVAEAVARARRRASRERRRQAWPKTSRAYLLYESYTCTYNIYISIIQCVYIYTDTYRYIYIHII